MDALLGFIIAMAIALTGVGAGSLTAPLLMLVLGVSSRECIGTALVFGACVKLISAPVYILRRQVNGPALLRLLAGGLPGVMLGSLLTQQVNPNMMMCILGATIVGVSGLNLLHRPQESKEDRSKWLSAVALPIGAEVGFSSAGAGALGALALFRLSLLDTATVVGTDICFGLVLSLVGGGIHAALGSVNVDLVQKLLLGGIPGAIVGSILAAKLPSPRLRSGMSAAMMLLGANICWKGFSLL